MQNNPGNAEQFRPNSVGYYATIAAFSALFALAVSTILVDQSNTAGWLLVVISSCTIALALASARLTVAHNIIIIFCLGASRVFPTIQIDRRRFDDLALQGMFRLSLQNGYFVIIPRAAFVSAAPFAAIEVVTASAVTSSSTSNQRESF